MTMHRRPRELGTVAKSVSDFNDSHCVDIFQRIDGSWGFELYRRDVETAEGWFPTGHYSGSLFATQSEATRAACSAVAWLEPEI